MKTATRQDGKASRGPLTRDKVLEAAIELADAEGIDALSMRRLGQALGVEAMSLYHHVANKEAILDGIVDLVVGQFRLPDARGPWKSEIRQTAISAHDILVRHPWAASLMLTPTRMSTARLQYMEGILSTLRNGGFSPEGAHHGYHALDSHISGFTLWQVHFQIEPGQMEELVAAFFAQAKAGEYRYLMEHAEVHQRDADPEDEGEFAFGLDLILDGLERLLDSNHQHPASPGAPTRRGERP